MLISEVSDQLSKNDDVTRTASITSQFTLELGTRAPDCRAKNIHTIRLSIHPALNLETKFRAIKSFQNPQNPINALPLTMNSSTPIVASANTNANSRWQPNGDTWVTIVFGVVGVTIAGLQLLLEWRRGLRLRQRGMYFWLMVSESNANI
jgi:hypothetical protein